MASKIGFNPVFLKETFDKYFKPEITIPSCSILPCSTSFNPKLSKIFNGETSLTLFPLSWFPDIVKTGILFSFNFWTKLIAFKKVSLEGLDVWKKSPECKTKSTLFAIAISTASSNTS